MSENRTVDRPIVHLFCNAHIDPVWMWAWEEGARESVSTFRTAVDLLDEFPEFIFNHNESLVYEWVEEYDPPLFERIRQLVRAGRWNITGGWYLQPDCNLPGGETLVRVILEGRRYFQQKFGIRPPVAYNFDTFGHPGGLPQLLRQSGYEMYVHCRPTPDQLELPAGVYCWQGVDGSEVISVRPEESWYCTPGSGQAQAQARSGVRIARKTGRDVLVTWGLGDHGGGATRQDLQLFRDMIDEMRGGDVELRHSTPEAFLERIRRQATALPAQRGELQRTLAGCYTSVAPIKRAMREGEALLASAERWAAIAWWRYGWPYPAEQLRDAWKRLMLNTFHDTLCGSLIEHAIPGVQDMFGYAHDVARRVIVKSQHAMLPNVPPTPGTIPLYVFNPHSVPMRAPIGVNFLSYYAPPPQKRLFALYDDSGARVTSQTGGGSAVLAAGTWNPHVQFVTDVPPLTARRYEIRFEQTSASSPRQPLSAQDDEAGIRVENTWWSIRFARDSAAPVELIERSSGRNLFKAPLQLFAMEDVSHAWGGTDRAIFNVPVSPLTALSAAEVGDFVGLEGQQGPALRIIARGPVSITVECLVGWQHTRASIRLTLYAELPYIDIDTRLYMQARRKMIKLVFPFDLPDTHAICEVPYGAAERPADATEWPYARWLRLETPGITVGIANNGQNGFDVSADGRLGLSISRGAVHSSWEGDPGGFPIEPSNSYTFMDQEQIDTRFRLLAGPQAEAVAALLIPAALELNQPFERFFSYNPPTSPAPANPAPFLSVDVPTVSLAALKKAEDGDALIVRLAETVGKPVTAQIRLENGSLQAMDFAPFEIKTFKLDRHDRRWTPCNLLEE
jgi:alpha-mannosidase